MGSKEVMQKRGGGRVMSSFKMRETLSNGNDPMEIKRLMMWEREGRITAAKSFEMRSLKPHAQRKR